MSDVREKTTTWHQISNPYVFQYICTPLAETAGWLAGKQAFSCTFSTTFFVKYSSLFVDVFNSYYRVQHLSMHKTHTHTQSTRLAAWSKSTFKSSIMKRVYISPKWKKTTHTHKTTTCSNNNTKIDHWNAWLWSIEPIWNHRKWFVYFTTWIDLCV